MTLAEKSVLSITHPLIKHYIPNSQQVPQVAQKKEVKARFFHGKYRKCNGKYNTKDDRQANRRMDGSTTNTIYLHSIRGAFFLLSTMVKVSHRIRTKRNTPYWYHRHHIKRAGTTYSTANSHIEWYE